MTTFYTIAAIAIVVGILAGLRWLLWQFIAPIAALDAIRWEEGPDTPFDDRNDHLRNQQPRRLRVGQSNHGEGN